MSHPEDFCQKCGEPNPVWYTDSRDWNKTYAEVECIVCPNCFIRDYEAVHGKRLWRVEVSE